MDVDYDLDDDNGKSNDEMILMGSFFFFDFIDFGLYISPGMATSILVFWVVTLFWISSFFHYVQAYLVAAAAKSGDSGHKNCIYLSMVKPLVLSFGSLCFASILLGPTRFFVIVFEIIRKVFIVGNRAVLVMCAMMWEQAAAGLACLFLETCSLFPFLLIYVSFFCFLFLSTYLVI